MAIQFKQAQKMRAAFIAFEGVDGSGKSTQIQLLRQRMQEKGIPAHFTREPTDLPAGALLQRILSGEIPSDERTIALLFAADRVDHLLHSEQGILRLLGAGISVVTDRFYFSSYAYQGTEVPLEWLIACNSQSAALRRPDIHIFLDLAPEESLRRILARKEKPEIYETEARLRMVREGYFRAFDQLRETETVVTLDAAQPEQQLSEAIWNCLVTHNFFTQV